ncbi:hypothetical protein WRPBWLFC_CDS0052 [Escherichia phage SM_S22]
MTNETTPKTTRCQILWILKRARTRVIILPSHCLLLVSAVAFCFGAFFLKLVVDSLMQPI